MLNPEYIHYVVDSGLGVLLWRGIMVANRILNVLKDYPPHAHINGNIAYPKGFEPPEVVRLYGTSGAKQ